MVYLEGKTKKENQELKKTGRIKFKQAQTQRILKHG